MSLTDKLWGIEGIMTNKLEEDGVKEDYIQGTTQFYRSLYCVCMGPWLPVKDEYISQKEVEKSEPKTSKKKDENNATSSNSGGNNNNNSNSNNNNNSNYDIDGWPPLPTFSDNNNTFNNNTAGRTSPTFPPLSKVPSHERRSESAFPRRQATMPSPPNSHTTAIPSTPHTQTTTPSPLLPPMRNSIILEKNNSNSNNNNNNNNNTNANTTTQTTQPSTQPAQYPIANTTQSNNTSSYSSTSGSNSVNNNNNNNNNVSSLPSLRQRHSEYNLQEPTELEPQVGRGYEKRRHRHAVSRGGSLPITQISFSPDDVTYTSSGKGPPFFSIPERSKPR